MIRNNFKDKIEKKMVNPTFETLLIKEVKSRPLLWDVFNTDYHNKPLKKETWNEISGLLNVAESDCYKRWRSLRDRFVATLKNRHYSCKVGRKWKYMEEMMFLKELTLGKKPGGTNSMQRKISNFNFECVTDEDFSHDGTNPINGNEETTTHFMFVDTTEEDETDEKISINNEEQNTTTTATAIINHVDKYNKKFYKNDSVDPFLSVIGEFFEKIPAKHRIAFKMDVLNYIYKKFDELNS